MKEQEEDFAQGIIWAAGLVASDHGDQVIAKDIVFQSGISIDKAAEACCEYDLARVRKAMPDIPKGKE